MPNSSIKTILLVEDSAGEVRLLREMMRGQDSHDIELIHVECMKEAEEYLAEHTVDIVLLDLGLPDAQGVQAIRRAHKAAPEVPLVVLTGLDDEGLAAKALQEGAQDYLIKGEIEQRGILRALRYAVERKRLERLKDEFVSSVSHELRTPLTSISGALGLLVGQAAGNLSESTARLLTIAHNSSQRLVRLVGDILDIDKLESGLVAFKRERVEIRSLVEQAIDANLGFSEMHDVRIRLDDKCAACSVAGDSDRVAQVVTNLLSNAIKFSPAGSEVVVEIEEKAEIVRVSVRDQGPGIPKDFEARVFERFAQANATNDGRKGGTGLGLCIVKQIVNRLGGTVGFSAAPGGGTIFQFELPRWRHAVAEPVTRGSNCGNADAPNFARAGM